VTDGMELTIIADRTVRRGRIDRRMSTERSPRWSACWLRRWHQHCVIVDVVRWRWRRWWRRFDRLPRSFHCIQLKIVKAFHMDYNLDFAPSSAKERFHMPDW